MNELAGPSQGTGASRLVVDTGCHPWMPVSPCGPGCVSEPVEQVSAARAALRTATTLSVVLFGLVLVGLRPVLRGNTRRVARWWFVTVLRAIGLRVQLYGDSCFQPVAGRGVLVVSNHVSWLDALVLSAIQPIAMVAKRDIKDWPVIGRLVSGVGSVFIDRGRLTELPGTVSVLAAVLRSGRAVGATPEGTTWCGVASGRFRPALFQAAVEAGVPVRPVALRYRLADGTATTAAAFVGHENLVGAIRRVLRIRRLVAEVHVLPELAPGRASARRELAALAESAVTAELGVAAGIRHRCGSDQTSSTLEVV
ncbi:MAG: 1-acyl-sn-glycerol-3-phosphate acyltransferase [Kutzneria sp.]|nr:1-acyl-sn-glycerol-3-phosphate acyltransferase [Kutzneria sp.]